MKKALSLYKHSRIRSWNQPVLSNRCKVSCSRKQRQITNLQNKFTNNVTGKQTLNHIAKGCLHYVTVILGSLAVREGEIEVVGKDSII